LLFWGCELGVYFAYKAARRDFSSWVLIESNGANVAIGAICRFAQKIAVDFSAKLQDRHPWDMGDGLVS